MSDTGIKTAAQRLEEDWKAREAHQDLIMFRGTIVLRPWQKAAMWWMAKASDRIADTAAMREFIWAAQLHSLWAYTRAAKELFCTDEVLLNYHKPVVATDEKLTMDWLDACPLDVMGALCRDGQWHDGLQAAGWTSLLKARSQQEPGKPTEPSEAASQKGRGRRRRRRRNQGQLTYREVRGTEGFKQWTSEYSRAESQLACQERRRTEESRKVEEFRKTEEFKTWASKSAKKEALKLDQWRKENKEVLQGPDPEGDAGIARAQAEYCARMAARNKAIPADPALARARAALITARDMRQIEGIFSDAEEDDEDQVIPADLAGAALKTSWDISSDADEDDEAVNTDSLSTCESFCRISEGQESFCQVGRTDDKSEVIKERKLIADLLSPIIRVKQQNKEGNGPDGRQGDGAASRPTPEMAQATLHIHRVLQNHIESRIRRENRAAVAGAAAAGSKAARAAAGDAAAAGGKTVSLA